MPFKLRKFKKKQQYNVASRSVFVITVELLDNAILECTLTADSTGRDCMDNVCQRLGLQQPDLFGLRYISRRSYPKIRWVDLDRPLKKQLDKYAQELYLYLSVMFYVNDVSLLEDEVTRYHYFLQLKMDVIEGRLRCNYEQAIVLASYSLQAEFGDHDPEKHTLEYLQDFALLPKPMMQQFPEEKLGTLTDAIISQHASLRGIAQQLAEVYYIVGAQQLDGYGQECFLAKDDTGNEVLIGASLTGIVVRKGNALSPQFFKWHDITNLVNHKRYFGVECQNYEFSVQFLLDEPDSAKYVWKMCVLQHTFYKMHASATESNELNIRLEHSNQPTPPQQQQHQHLKHHRSQFDILLDPSTIAAYPTTIQHSEIQNFHQQTQRVDISPMKIQTKSNLVHSIHDPVNVSNALDMTNNTTLQQSYNNYILRQSSNSVNDLGRSVGNDLDQVHQFRQVPDYETAIRNKYGIMAANQLHQQQFQSNQQFQQLQHSVLYNSQPSLITDSLSQNMLVENHYQNNQQLHQHHLFQGDTHHQSAYSSTPELNRTNLNHHHPTRLNQQQHPIGHDNEETHDQIVAELQRLNLYKPPPPYPGPYAKVGSTSTPDLAGVNNLNTSGHQVVGIGGSSPDLVSRRNNLPSYHPQSNGGHHHVSTDNHHIHRTFGNLHSMDYRNAYSTEELNSVVYRLDPSNNNEAVKSHLVHDILPTNFMAYSHRAHLGFGQQQTQPVNQSCNEPIYQNQQQLSQQLLEQEEEPIYQNLPIHEKILYKQRQLEKQQQLERDSVSSSAANESIHIDETVDSADPVQSAIVNNQISHVPIQQKLKGHVSRVAITNSRENLHGNGSSEVVKSNLNFVYDEDLSHSSAEATNNSASNAAAVNLGHKKSVTKISIGGGEVSKPTPSDSDRKLSKTEELISAAPTKNSSAKSPENSVRNAVRKYSEDLYIPEPNMPQSLRDAQGGNNMPVPPRTPGQKPRAGRKRWTLNFGSKTGSLKSVKSESGSHKSQDSLDGSSSVSKGQGFGPLMMATLHGLTRSRPDLLAESMATFSQPSKMPKEEIGAYLESKLEQGEVLREFERIPKKKLQGCHFNTAVLAENIPRSRFKDVLPYDENRVRLSSVDKENKTGFINASHVSASVGPDQRFYIAAQGPLPNTVLHFWQMIFQCDVHLIVMLTDVSEASKTSSCIPYWPQKNGSTLELGDFKIIKQFTSNSASGAYTTSTLSVTHLPSKRQRTVWHLQFADWSDHGCPGEVRHYVEFLEEMASLRQLTATEIPAGKNRNPPVLVHCSAGVGRTGVTILCDILLYCVDHNLDVDVPKVLAHLRQQRMLMVQTIAQYKFVHTVLIHYIKQSRLI